MRGRPLAATVVEGDTYDLVHASELALVASGTATLETALLERPMVIVYRVAPLTFALARRLVSVPFIGMPNLIAQHAVVPELVQDDATGARLTQEAERASSTTPPCARPPRRSSRACAGSSAAAGRRARSPRSPRRCSA